VPASKIDPEFAAKLQQMMNDLKSAYKQFSLRRVTASLMELAQAGNVYFDAQKPWALAKVAETRPQMEMVVANCLECLKLMALASSPIIPQAAQKLWEMLGQKTVLADAVWDQVIKTPLVAEAQLPAPQILFKRVEDGVIQGQEEKLKALLTKQEKTHVSVK
jgi:methionyl-tRNA synthetase